MAAAAMIVAMTLRSRMNEFFVICYFDPLPRSLWRKERNETSLAYYRGRMDGWMDGHGRTDGRMNDEGRE